MLRCYSVCMRSAAKPVPRQGKCQRRPLVMRGLGSRLYLLVTHAAVSGHSPGAARENEKHFLLPAGSLDGS